MSQIEATHPQDDEELVYTHSGSEIDITSFGITKNRPGKIVDSGQRVMAYNVFMTHLKSGKSKTESVKLTREYVGISERLIWNIVKTMTDTHQLVTPSGKRDRKDLFRRLDENQRQEIRNIVDSLFLEDGTPTLKKILSVSIT